MDRLPDHAASATPLNAAELRRLGWAYADIASHLGMPVARAREFVLAKNTQAHVRAMQTSDTARIDRWPLERLKLDPAIQRVLLNYAVVTVGHLLVLDRQTLEAMRLDDRAIRAVLKAVPDVCDRSDRPSPKRNARAS